MESPKKYFLSRIYLIFVCYIPMSAVILAGMYVIYRMFGSPLAFEGGKLFFGFDLATASLAGLSYYASYASMDKTRKVNYYDCAENFFHAMVLFIFITFLQEVIIRLKVYISDGLGQNFAVSLLGTSVIICFVFAFKHFVKGIFRLLKTFNLVAHEKDEEK